MANLEEMPSPKPKGKKLKRILMAILLPILLFIIAGMVITIVGPNGMSSVEKNLERFWFVGTAIRFVIMIVISFVIIPFIMQKRRDEKLRLIKQLQLSGDSDDEAYIELLQRQVKGIEHIKPWVICLFFILMDIILLQIPFFIR